MDYITRNYIICQDQYSKDKMREYLQVLPLESLAGSNRKETNYKYVFSDGE